MNINSVWQTRKKNVDKILTTRPLKKDLCPSLALSLRTSDNNFFFTNTLEGAHDNIHYNMRYETMTNILHGIIRTIDVRRYPNPILLLL